MTMYLETERPRVPNASKPRKRFIGRNTVTSKVPLSTPVAHQIPQEILVDPRLNHAIEALPSNYSFEIHKTIHNVRKNSAKMVALQFPEGLQMFACVISDIIESFTTALTIIMGDVTYGACCIDDYTAAALGCDMLIHYGHSCLVPIDQTSIKTLYIFVEIGIDSLHLVQTVRTNIPSDRDEFYAKLQSENNAPSSTSTELSRHLTIQHQHENDTRPTTALSYSPAKLTRIAMVSTIQFVTALQKLKEDLSVGYPEPVESSAVSVQHACVSTLEDSLKPTECCGRYEAIIPRVKPLSPGEILGCTAPQLEEVDALIYLGDGRFHLESIMISNPEVPAFRYDPYSKKLTRERYDHHEMRSMRDQAVSIARLSVQKPGTKEYVENSRILQPAWGVVLGTLGRQGSLKQLQAITHQLSVNPTPVPYVPILLSELSPAKLALFSPRVSIFVQTSCPRLSIDWGYAFDRPLLTPYEASVAMGKSRRWMEKESHNAAYPMDFYATGSPWAVSRTKGRFPDPSDT